MQLETNEVIVKITNYNNYKCGITYYKNKKNGTIFILIKEKPQTIVLIVEFQNINLNNISKILKSIN